MGAARTPSSQDAKDFIGFRLALPIYSPWRPGVLAAWRHPYRMLWQHSLISKTKFSWESIDDHSFGQVLMMKNGQGYRRKPVRDIRTRA